MRATLLFMVMMVCLFSGAWAEEPTAIIKTMQGQVDFQRSGQPVRLSPGDALQLGDIIRTADNGSVGITFLDGTRISLGPASEMRLDAFRFTPIRKDYAFDVYMNKGSAAFSSGKMGKLAPEAVRFSTPNATVGIRGTKFLVQVK
ncbi:MAG: FecR domain-containing protein [Thermodesulfobacteriota bacterium]